MATTCAIWGNGKGKATEAERKEGREKDRFDGNGDAKNESRHPQKGSGQAIKQSSSGDNDVISIWLLWQQSRASRRPSSLCSVYVKDCFSFLVLLCAEKLSCFYIVKRGRGRILKFTSCDERDDVIETSNRLFDDDEPGGITRFTATCVPRYSANNTNPNVPRPMTLVGSSKTNSVGMTIHIELTCWRFNST